MKTLIAFVAILGVACATNGILGNVLGEAAEAVGGLTRGVANVAGGAVGVVAEGALGLANGAAQVLLGFQKYGKSGYAEIFHYYNNIGITIHLDYGCCSCPAHGVVQPGYPNYSPHSPFFIYGVYQLDYSQYCTCPPELIAAAIEISYHEPALFGSTIGEFVQRIPLQATPRIY